MADNSETMKRRHRAVLQPVAERVLRGKLEHGVFASDPEAVRSRVENGFSPSLWLAWQTPYGHAVSLHVTAQPAGSDPAAPWVASCEVSAVGGKLSMAPAVAQAILYTEVASLGVEIERVSRAAALA